jgi:hypothetical protein
VKYIRRNFLCGLQGREPSGLRDLNAHLRAWETEALQRTICLIQRVVCFVRLKLKRELGVHRATYRMMSDGALPISRASSLDCGPPKAETASASTGEIPRLVSRILYLTTNPARCDAITTFL